LGLVVLPNCNNVEIGLTTNTATTTEGESVTTTVSTNYGVAGTPVEGKGVNCVEGNTTPHEALALLAAAGFSWCISILIMVVTSKAAAMASRSRASFCGSPSRASSASSPCLPRPTRFPSSQGQRRRFGQQRLLLRRLRRGRHSHHAQDDRNPGRDDKTGAADEKPDKDLGI
jgi:hypothetical protein